MIKTGCSLPESQKYQCTDTSPLSKYILNPFWNQLVKIFPLWLAPNLMTLLGFLILVSQTILLLYYDPYYEVNKKRDSIPAWVWLYSAFAQFVAHSLDGIDGKQARRTGTSSPLGELFDHGLDSLVPSLVIFNVISLFGCSLVPVTHMMILFMVVLFSMFLSHWEKYLTGVFYLPWASDLSQLVVVFAFLVAGVYGSQIWHGSLLGISYASVYLVIAIGSCLLLSIPTILYNVYISSRDDGFDKKRNFSEMLIPLFSPLLCIVVFAVWCAVSPSDILSFNPRLILFAFAIIFSNLTCRIIVAHMSGSCCQLVNPFVMVVVLCFILALLFEEPFIELIILWSFVVSATLAHLHYGIVLVRSLAEHFSINVFTIKLPVS